MGKKYGTRKFRKLRKGSKNYSTRRNKSGGTFTLGKFGRYFTSDGRLLEEFKKKIRHVSELKELLDTPDPTLEESEILNKIGLAVVDLKTRRDATNENFGLLKNFVDRNNDRLINILENMDMQIEKRAVYKKIREEVTRLGDDVVGNFSMRHDNADRALPPTPSRPPGTEDDDAGAGASATTDAKQVNNYYKPYDGDKKELLTKPQDKENLRLDENNNVVYVNSKLRCPRGNEENLPPFFTCEYVEHAIKNGEILPVAVCKVCYESKRNHIPEQGGGSRRRRRNTRSRKNKTRRNGKCRSCRCPGGCKRSTCPCYRGRSKPCCTKRCRSRGQGCRC
jgi:hypothetical protein